MTNWRFLTLIQWIAAKEDCDQKTDKPGICCDNGVNAACDYWGCPRRKDRGVLGPDNWT